MELERLRVRAPEFSPADWINAPGPLEMAALRGRVVLLDIWDFTSLDCLETLPYLRAWYDRYAENGLELIGVHTPEFRFARLRGQTEAAARRLGIRWPVVLDNEQAIWHAYQARGWPTVYLIDHEGYLRFRHAGEGGYNRIEPAIQALLQEVDPKQTFPEPMPPVRPEDAAGAVCAPTTPDLQADDVGNFHPPVNIPNLLSIPEARIDGHFYLEGLWAYVGDGVALAGQRGTVVLPYHARSVHAVVSPAPDPVALELRLFEGGSIALEQDGRPLPPDRFGEDVFLDQGLARARVEAARCYSLVRNPDVEPHELHLRLFGRGLTLHEFSFATRIADRFSQLTH